MSQVEKLQQSINHSQQQIKKIKDILAIDGGLENIGPDSAVMELKRAIHTDWSKKDKPKNK